MRFSLALSVIVVAFTVLSGGCPQEQQVPVSDVTARIGISSTSGAAPLAINVTAVDSSSINGGPLTYLWDFDDGTVSSEMATNHTFESPGRYNVILRVYDPTGAEGIASEIVQVQGGDAVAIIAADQTSGPAPLTVQFDGTNSVATDDTVRDYYWDFDDGQTSREPSPTHTFTAEGEYRVTLRVVTAGGVEAETFTTITVGTSNAALQFDGGDYATLPLSIADGSAVTRFTCEAWVQAATEGGTVFSVGSQGSVSVELVPSTNTAQLQAAGTTVDATASSLAGVWRHVAVVYDAGSTEGQESAKVGGEPGDGEGAGTCTLYLDGQALTSATVTGAVSPDQITIGVGMRGKIADVRFWVTARTLTELNATRDTRLSGTEANLIGYWKIDEGSGQTLENSAGGGDGTLGSTSSTENADPAWSSEGPPVD